MNQYGLSLWPCLFGSNYSNFSTKNAVAFEEVRTQMPTELLLQERVTGMKIVQPFTREVIEADKFKEINDKHKKAWIKTILYNSIFFSNC
jgi:hypothetical protein